MLTFIIIVYFIIIFRNTDKHYAACSWKLYYSNLGAWKFYYTHLRAEMKRRNRWHVLYSDIFYYPEI